MIVSENVQQGIVELFIPYCMRCRTAMVPEKGLMLTPKEETMLHYKPKFRIKLEHKNILPKQLIRDTASGVEGTQPSRGIIASFSMYCPNHPAERETLTSEQLEVINKYPVGKQVYRKIPLTKRVN